MKARAGAPGTGRGGCGCPDAGSYYLRRALVAAGPAGRVSAPWPPGWLVAKGGACASGRRCAWCPWPVQLWQAAGRISKRSAAHARPSPLASCAPAPTGLHLLACRLPAAVRPVPAGMALAEAHDALAVPAALAEAEHLGALVAERSCGAVPGAGAPAAARCKVLPAWALPHVPLPPTPPPCPSPRPIQRGWSDGSCAWGSLAWGGSVQQHRQAPHSG
jgi:hypothetical protein